MNLLRHLTNPTMKPQKRASPRTAVEWCQEGATAEEGGDWARAVVCYRRALEIAPFCSQTRNAFEWAIEQQIESKMKRRRPAAPAAPLAAVPTEREKKRAFGSFERDEEDSSDEVEAPRPMFFDEQEAPVARKPKAVPSARMSRAEEARRPRAKSGRRLILPLAVFISVLVTTTGLLMAATTSNFLRGVLFSDKLPTVETVKLPDALVARLTDAGSLLEKGEPKRAVDRLQEALKEFPEQEAMLNPELARALRALGLSENRQQRFESAAEAFRHATKAEPQNVLNWIDLGRALREEARSASLVSNPEKQREVLRNAEAAFIRAQVLAPRDGAALFGLAQVYVAMNRRQEAVVAYERVVSEAPTSRERQLAEEALRELRKQ